VLALAPQLSVTDADGRQVLYIRQKLFKLKESVTIYEDDTQSTPLYHINADRILDISARYHITDVSGHYVGTLRRHGLKSIWRSHYDILDADTPIMTIREANPWVKLIDELVGEVPVLGFFTGYIFHPVYEVTAHEGMPLMRMEKQPAFFESRFKIESRGVLDEKSERLALLSLIMTVLLERSRG
jgi:uncharacterized protein YxjI